MINLSSPEIYDKIYGCWMGKNCGGTLGAPLEKSIGEPEPFDVWWYPKLQEGGIPNDDLEMQLVWLKAFEEHGVALNAQVLAQYWLNHIGYNSDEYGWSRMNLRLGLLPPISGNYNNWFVDCMGCPIRSEIFACVAPGLPRTAARYAYEDAITDHAGGESVYGEMFHAAIEASAFLISSLPELLDIGRSYVRNGTKTAAAIDAARQAHRDGLDWKGARKRVLEAAPHYNAQYSPLNMGFEVIGLLYGRDFADSLCITVNCGYDTDCTGATVGAIIGIIQGCSRLPTKWTDPLGDKIATNESWGGLRNCAVGPNPIPRNLQDLTNRTLAVARKISAGLTPERDALLADDSIRELWHRPATRVTFSAAPYTVGVDYLDTPAAKPGDTKRLTTVISNTAPLALTARCVLRVPQGWVAPAAREVPLNSLGQAALDWAVPIPAPSHLENSNTLYLEIQTPQRPAQPAIPVPLIGARRMLLSAPYTAANASREGLFEQTFAPEALHGSPTERTARSGAWSIYHSLGNDLGLDSHLAPNNAIYVRAFFNSPTVRRVILGLPTTGSVRGWVNGELTHDFLKVELFRPHGHKSQVYVEVGFRAGFNEVLVKLVRPAGPAPFEAHLILVDPVDLNAGFVDLGWTRLPWDDLPPCPKAPLGKSIATRAGQ